mmetsp:Transcript_8412/g.16182  ORF Transcript_8412/g.16182 Transcript_8412/m.16182 type:complete len:231 (-) Transcript_8412:192-884(-)
MSAVGSSMTANSTGSTKGHRPGTSPAAARICTRTALLLRRGTVSRGSALGSWPWIKLETMAGSRLATAGSWSSFLSKATPASWNKGLESTVLAAGRWAGFPSSMVATVEARPGLGHMHDCSCLHTSASNGPPPLPLPLAPRPQPLPRSFVSALRCSTACASPPPTLKSSTVDRMGTVFFFLFLLPGTAVAAIGPRYTSASNSPKLKMSAWGESPDGRPPSTLALVTSGAL